MNGHHGPRPRLRAKLLGVGVETRIEVVGVERIEWLRVAAGGSGHPRELASECADGVVEYFWRMGLNVRVISVTSGHLPSDRGAYQATAPRGGRCCRHENGCNEEGVGRAPTRESYLLRLPDWHWSGWGEGRSVVSRS